MHTVNSNGRDIVAYDIVNEGTFYKSYAKMLNLDFNISPFEVLENAFDKNEIPECFWVLDAHGDHISKSEFFKNNESIKEIAKFEFYRARGILYSFNVDSSACSVIDFD